MSHSSNLNTAVAWSKHLSTIMNMARKATLLREPGVLDPTKLAEVPLNLNRMESYCSLTLSVATTRGKCYLLAKDMAIPLHVLHGTKYSIHLQLSITQHVPLFPEHKRLTRILPQISTQ